MFREDAGDRSPTSSYHPAMPPSNTLLVDIFDEPAPAVPTTASSLDDIFDCSEPSSPNQTIAGLQQHVSDIPRLRSVHVTAGYRDGIAKSKASHVQSGFDEGFPLGAMLGLRVGWILGVLNNLTAALKIGAAEAGAQGELLLGLSESVDRLRCDAIGELSMIKLFGEQYFDGEGTWRYDAGEEDGGITFREVASRHPLVKKWVEIVERQALALHADLAMLQRQGDAQDQLVLV